MQDTDDGGCGWERNNKGKNRKRRNKTSDSQESGFRERSVGEGNEKKQ